MRDKWAIRANRFEKYFRKFTVYAYEYAYNLAAAQLNPSIYIPTLAIFAFVDVATLDPCLSQRLRDYVRHCVAPKVGPGERRRV